MCIPWCAAWIWCVGAPGQQRATLECDMADKLSPNDIERLRRAAKKTARDTGITHINALDQSANKLGFPNWAEMQHHLAAAPVRYPIFRRSFEEMRAAFHGTRPRGGIAGFEARLRQQMPDLSIEFANPISAMEYARDYLRLALTLPRIIASPYSAAGVEMRVLLPYALEPVDHKFLLVGRDYKPLGRALRDERVEYGASPNLHLDLPREAISRALPNTGTTFGYLYGDSPALGKTYARKYLRRLEALIEVAKQHESVSGH